MATWNRALPQREIDAALQTVPTTAADLTTTDTYIFQMVFTNTGAGSTTIKVVDKQGTPKVLVSDQSTFAAGNTVVFAFPQGAFMKGGVNWVVSGTVDAQIYGFVV
jgi:hypothetical protein